MFHFYTKYISQEKEFELILKVKMESRYPVEGQFVSEMPATSNHCGGMTVVRPEFLSNVCVFL